MTSAQRIIKYIAIAFAIFLAVNIISVAIFGVYEIINAFGLVKQKDDTSIISQGMKEIPINTQIEDLSNLEISIGFTNLKIKRADKFKIETNSSKVSLFQDDNRVVIKEENYKLLSKKQAKDLVVYIPEEISTLNNVKIEAGAGEVVIDDLETQRLDLDLGAGKVLIEKLVVTKEAKIEGGAGKAEILSSEIQNLDLDLGVGEFKLNAKLVGKNTIDAGVGAVNINLTDGIENYTINADKGIGSIKVDGKEISNSTNYGNGSTSIKIDGGIGSINIK